MLIVTPGINLAGQCAEAMALYEKAFDATIKFILRYSDADMHATGTSPSRTTKNGWFTTRNYSSERSGSCFPIYR